MAVPKKNIAGRQIAAARSAAGLTQDQLSAKLARVNVPIDRAGIAKIENGLRRIYDYELKALAKVLKTTPESLLSG